jgi:hypothetical protein
VPKVTAPKHRVTHPVRHTLSRIFLPWKETARLERELTAARLANTAIAEAAHRYYTQAAA